MDDVAHRADVRHAPFDALGHQLLGVDDVLLEVAVLRERAGLHGSERPHAPVALVALALVEHRVARALVGAGEQRAEHGAVGAGSERLGDVAGELETTVGDDRATTTAGDLGTVEHGGDLRHADTGDHPRGADRARADADLDGIGAGVDQRLGRRGRGDVAGDERAIPDLAHLAHRLGDRRGVAVRRVDHDRVDPGVDELFGTVEHVGAGADRGGDAEATLGILGRVREVGALLEVLDGDEASQEPVGVDDGQLLDLDVPEHLLGLVECGAHGHRVQALRRHDLVDATAEVGLEAEVTVGEDADQTVLLVGDRDAGDVEALHEIERCLHWQVRLQRDGVGDHARLRTLDPVDLSGLLLGRQVAVDDADSAEARQGDGHA